VILAVGDPALTGLALRLFVVLFAARLLGERAGRAGVALVVGLDAVGTLGWLLLSIVAGMATRSAGAGVDSRAVGLTVAALVAFLLAAFGVGQWAVDAVYARTRRGCPSATSRRSSS
jgi:Kef-type K+ transport system membrane component KefB